MDEQNPARPRFTEFDYRYAVLVQQLLDQGGRKPSRQGVDTFSCTAAQIRVGLGRFVRSPRPERGGEKSKADTNAGAGDDAEDETEADETTVQVRDFPTMHSKRVALSPVLEELAWFLRGETNAKELAARGCHIWDADAAKAADRGFDYPEGELGPIYGRQWRGWGGDQIRKAVEALARNPFDRGNVVSAWNAGEIGEMVLRPCHYAFQFVCRRKPSPSMREKRPVVDCVVNMRSTDVGLGLPFNVTSYALLTVLCVCEAAHMRGVPPADAFELGELVVNMADCHIYAPHIEALSRVSGAVLEDRMKEIDDSVAPLEEILRRAASDIHEHGGELDPLLLYDSFKPAAAEGLTLRLPPALQSTEGFARAENDSLRRPRELFGAYRPYGAADEVPGWKPPALRLELFV